MSILGHNTLRADILQHLRDHGPSTTAQLRGALLRPPKAVGSALGNLKHHGLIQKTTASRHPESARWALVERAGKPEPAPELHTCRWVPDVGGPRQYDIQRAPAWRPPPMGSARPGADDHLRHKSLGHRC